MNARPNKLVIDFEWLQQQIINQLKPKYKALVQDNHDSEKAYALSYDEAVTLIAKVTHVSQGKTKFTERILLQKIMHEVSL